MKKTTFLLLAILLLSACGSAQVETRPAAVIEDYEEKWNAKDIEGVLDMMAEDIVETNGRGLFYGRESLRDLYITAMDAFSLDCGNYRVVGNEVYYYCLEDFYEGDRVQVEEYQSIVVDGKIKANILVQTFDPPAGFKIDSSY